MGSAVSGALGGIGGIVGGIIGQNNASGYASQSSNEAGMANNIMQQMAAVPTIDQPLILEQYRQAGVLTPAMEQQINLGVSQASQVKANPALAAAQNQALQSMAQRSQMGLTASDRAAFNQLQQQVGSQTQGRLQAIQQQQQAQTGGQGTQGATLAAKLSASQGGANTEATNADQLAAQASNNALQATAQYGSMAGQMNSQQFSQQEEAAKAADSFRQFDVQNQVAQQQRNTAAQNAAQQYNLNLGQNISNANVSQANQAQLTQRQLAAQQWGMQYQQAVGQSQAAAGYGNTLSGMAQQTAQAGANLGAGIGGVASQMSSGPSKHSGGEIRKALGYADGGTVNPNINGLNPIQLATLGAAPQTKFADYKMPQRGAMPPINFAPPQPPAPPKKAGTAPKKTAAPSTPAPQGSAVEQAAAAHSQGPSDSDFEQAFKSGGTDKNAPSNADYDAAEAAATAGAGDKTGAEGQVDATQAANEDQSSYNQQLSPEEQASDHALNQDIAQQGTAADTNPNTNMSVQGSINPADTNESISQGDTAYASALGQAGGGQISGDYRSGGKVPGKPVVKGDDPANDIVPARLSPGEVVLPRSIAMKLKNAPDGDFNKHLNNIVGPFIRKSQAMADGGQVMDMPKPIQPMQPNPPQRYAEGGEAEHNKKNLSALDRAFHNFIKEEAKEYADGGSVSANPQSPDEAGIEAIARKNAILKAAGIDPQQSDDERQIEAEESSRRGYKNQSSNNQGYDDGGEVDYGGDSGSDDSGSSGNAQPDNSGGDDGIDPNDPDSIKLASTPQIQQAAATDTGAPPPRGPMAANTYAGPPGSSSSGSGGGSGGGGSGMSSIMSMLPMLAMAANKGGEASLKRLQKFDDGGQVEDSAWNRLVKNLHDQFAPAPTPEPTPDPSDHTKEYEKIRHQNLVNMGESNDNDSSASGMHKGGKVKNVLSMLKSINGYADGTDNVQQDDPNSTPAPDTDDDEDTAIVRANPDSNAGIDQVAQNEFQEDQEQPSEDSNELDRSKEPADLEMVKKDEEQESPEEKARKEKEFEENFKTGEEQPQDQEQQYDLTNQDVAALGDVSPSATPDEEQPLKSPEEKMSNLQQQLKRAQAQRYAILQGAQGAKYGALLAAGIAGHGAKPVGAEYFNSDKLADLPVKNLQEQIAMEKDDPTSAQSKFYRQRLEQSLNMKIAPDVSASGMEKMFPQVTKIVGAEYQLNAKKQMADIAQQNKMILQKQKQEWQQNQNDLSRQSQLQGHKMMADAMGIRATLPAVTNAVNQVENDPVVKPLRIGQQALSLSKSILENPDLPVTPAVMNDASNGFTQALALRPGAVTQKRYDATKITTLKNQVAAFVAKATDNPDLDMRTYDPALYNTLHNYINTLHNDYNTRLQGERNRLIKEKSNAFKAAGAPTVASAVDTMNDTGAAGMTPPPAATPARGTASVPGQTPGKTVVKKGYNPKTNQTQFIYDDGTKETKPGKL